MSERERKIERDWALRHCKSSLQPFHLLPLTHSEVLVGSYFCRVSLVSHKRVFRPVIRTFKLIARILFMWPGDASAIPVYGVHVARWQSNDGHRRSCGLSVYSISNQATRSYMYVSMFPLDMLGICFTKLLCLRLLGLLQWKLIGPNSSKITTELTLTSGLGWSAQGGVGSILSLQGPLATGSNGVTKYVTHEKIALWLYRIYRRVQCAFYILI